MLKFSKEKLKDIMVAKKFDVKNLAEKSGVGVTTIYEILNGKKKNPKSETLSKLAYAMEIYLDDFFCDDNLPIDNNLDKNIYDNKLKKHEKMSEKEKIETEYKELLSKISKLDDSKKQLIKNLINEFEKSN